MIQYVKNVPDGFEVKIDTYSTMLGMPKFEVTEKGCSLKAIRDSRNSAKVNFYDGATYLGSEVIFSYDVRKYTCKEDYIANTIQHVCASLNALNKCS